MRSVSLELEILGRHQHPELTIPFLKVYVLFISDWLKTLYLIVEYLPLIWLVMDFSARPISSRVDSEVMVSKSCHCS